MSDHSRVFDQVVQVLYLLEVGYGWSEKGKLDQRQTTLLLSQQQVDDEALSVALDNYYDSFDAREKLRLETLSIVRGVLDSVNELDVQIESSDSTWRLERMNPTDRNILRLALFEAMTRDLLSRKQIINEAVELAKRFGDAESPRFVNGVLDALLSSRH